MSNVEQQQPTAKEIFLKACRLATAEERSAYLDQVCGTDTNMRRNIEAMVRVNVETGSNPLDRMGAMFGPTGAIPVPDQASPAWMSDSGRMIGPYKLLEQIGQGGFGTVYMADQTAPVKRKVALKVLKPGMDSGEVIARFEAERQALAMMDHPNIARVLDGGTTTEGRPYFVMELVRGVPITDYCDEARLTNEERLRLFVDVCRAVQHAHQKGIIHRDLKPSNVLVTMHDDKAVPKVIDFGIAKALSQQLTDRTLFTGYHQLLGTPMYMSPEQAQMSGIDVDTRSDVYSLGVLLYELLTGTTPFTKESLSNVSFDQLRKIIREQEPPRPSARMTTLDAQARSTAADRRKLDQRRISDAMRGELDWIVMKALEKNRNRRYESASAFAADIERYLNKEAVLACPPTLRYRLAKYAGKHKATLTTAAVLVLMLITSTIVSSFFAYQAHDAQVAAEDSEQQARDAEAEARTQAELATNEAKRADAAAASALLAKGREEEERRRAETALYVSDTRLAATEIRESAFVKGFDSLIRHYSIGSQQSALGWEWYYLLNQADQSLLSWQAGATDVQDIAWNPRKKQIAAVHWDSPEVRIWNSETGELIRDFDVSRFLTVGVSWSPDGEQLAWGSTPNDDDKTATLRIWDSTSDKIVELTAESFSQYTVEWSPDGSRIALTSISGGGVPAKLQIYSQQEGSWKLAVDEKWESPPGYDSLSWNDDGTKLFIGAHKKSIIVDPVTLEATFEFPIQGIRSGVWLRGDTAVATIAGRECIVFDNKNQEEIQRFEVGPASSIQLSKNGELLATAGSDGFVKIWNVADWSPVSLYEAHDGPVKSLTWSPDSTKIASSGSDGRISIWPAAKRERDAIVHKIGSDRSFVWTTAGAIQTYDPSRGVIEFDPTSGKVIRESGIDEPDNWRLIGSDLLSKRDSAEGESGTVILQGIGEVNGDYSDRFPLPGRIVGKPDGTACAYIPHGNAGMGLPVVVDVHSTRQLKLGALKLYVDHFEWSPDGKTIAAIGHGREGDDGTPMWAGWVHLFDLKSGAAINRARVGQNRVVASTGDWSPNSANIACGTGDGICEIFEANTLRKLLSRRTHRQTVRGMSWHPTEDRIASCGDDGTVAIWDAISGEVLLRFEIGQAVVQVEWSPDGKLLAARTNDGEYHIWNAAAGYDLAESQQFQKRCVERLEAELFSRLFVADFANAQRLGTKLLQQLQGQNNDGSMLYYILALLSINNGELSEYQRACKTMIVRFKESKVPDDLHFTAWTCALAPDAVNDYASVIKIARKSVAQVSANQQYLDGLGAILMRAGAYEEAHQVLTKALDVTATEKASPSYILYFLAMTEHHLGRREEAKKHLQQSNEFADQELTGMPPWNRKLTLELLRMEAETLIGKSPESMN